MTMKRRIFLCILSISMMLSSVIRINASDIVTGSQDEVIYTREENALFDKINDLAIAKSAVLQYKTMHQLVDDNNDPIYSMLVSEADSIRNELIAMGAKPSTEELAALKFEPVEIDGVLIGDFAGFENTYGDVFELWGVAHTVNTTYGTYYTYDVLIQDITGGQILSTSISQSNRPGWELHATGSSVSSLIEDEINSVAIDRVVECVANQLGHRELIAGAYTAFKSIFNLVSGIEPDEPVTVTGNTSSHIIYCDIVPTIHFVFVRASSTGAWQHSLTTNEANVLETHSLYYVISQDGSAVVINDDSYSYAKHVLPEEYDARLTNAIRAYRYNHSLYVDKLSGYTIIIKESIADSDGVEVFTLQITCPENQTDLFRHACNDCQIVLLIALAVSAVVCTLAIVVGLRCRRKQNCRNFSE